MAYQCISIIQVWLVNLFNGVGDDKFSHSQKHRGDTHWMFVGLVFTAFLKFSYTMRKQTSLQALMISQFLLSCPLIFMRYIYWYYQYTSLKSEACECSEMIETNSTLYMNEPSFTGMVSVPYLIFDWIILFNLSRICYDEIQVRMVFFMFLDTFLLQLETSGISDIVFFMARAD